MAKAKKEELDQEVNNVPEVNPYGKKNYQEWEVKIEKGRAEKLKINRHCVKITDDQAAVLNEGVVKGPNNTYAKMYFLPE
jgi:hypothetical protein